MGNVGTLSLSLQNAEGDSIVDGDVTLKFFRNLDGRQITDAIVLHLPPDPIQVAGLPAFPQESNLNAQVQETRYRFLITGFFTLNTNAPKQLPETLLRDPAKWNARFDLWNALPANFSGLKQVLGNSPKVELLNPNTPIGSFTGDVYDDVDDTNTILAKAALLNLHVALTENREPVTGQSNAWFSYVREILRIDRERFVAVVLPEMEELVRTVHDNRILYSDYQPVSAGLHVGNIPSRYGINADQMFSVKSNLNQCNIQLTMARGTDRDLNQRVSLLDADIDEDHELLAHIFDVLLKHPFTGGTHPFDIHEYLVLTYGKDVSLGYQLV